MELLANELIKELMAVNQSTCLSLYMPTHQRHPENLQDSILFKTRNLITWLSGLNRQEQMTKAVTIAKKKQ